MCATISLQWVESFVLVKNKTKNDLFQILFFNSASSFKAATLFSTQLKFSRCRLSKRFHFDYLFRKKKIKKFPFLCFCFVFSFRQKPSFLFRRLSINAHNRFSDFDCYQSMRAFVHFFALTASVKKNNISFCVWPLLWFSWIQQWAKKKSLNIASP